jgi:hypothetical protein
MARPTCSFNSANRPIPALPTLCRGSSAAGSSFRLCWLWPSAARRRCALSWTAAASPTSPSTATTRSTSSGTPPASGLLRVLRGMFGMGEPSHSLIVSKSQGFAHGIAMILRRRAIERGTGTCGGDSGQLASADTSCRGSGLRDGCLTAGSTAPEATTVSSWGCPIRAKLPSWPLGSILFLRFSCGIRDPSDAALPQNGALGTALSRNRRASDCGG